MKKVAVLLILFTLLSKILGFAREITLSYFYGATNISDAYFISQTIPLTIFAFIGTGVATSYIPMYSSIVKESGVKSADRFTNNIINIIIIICTLMVLIVLIFTVPVVKLFASGFEGETLKIAVNFTRYSIFAVYFSGLIFVLNGYLQLQKSFLVPALIGIPYNILIMMSVFTSSAVGVFILPIGSVLAVAVQLLVLVPFVLKKGYKYLFVLDWNDKHIKKIMILSIPIILGVSVNQINILVDKTIASHISHGSISALTYANTLNWFLQGIFVASISAIVYPSLTRMVIDKNLDALKNTLSQSIVGVSLLILPATAIFLSFPWTIVKVLFGRGAFDAQAVDMTSSALFYYSFGMIGVGLRELVSKVFYSFQDTKTPMLNAVFALILNIALNIILSKYLGVGGIALATSISSICCVILLIIGLRRKIGSIGLLDIGKSLIKIIIASTIMGLVARFIYRIFFEWAGMSLSLVISSCFGLILYFGLLHFLKIDVTDRIFKEIRVKMESKFMKA
jgi:putative peptidoglycan lipid II flippase